MITLLEHPEGRIRIEELGDGRRRITVHDPAAFIACSDWVTAYPTDLIERILGVKGASYLCDEIRREEDPTYAMQFLRISLLGFVSEEEFEGARILDFGSGSGASSVLLSRLFPTARVVGVELRQEFVDLANARTEHYGLTRVESVHSPDSEHLPSGLGTFDFINLGAVYEHLLPAERKRVLPQLWSVLKVGGVLFVNQLPHRYYVVEAHTTGLPLLNFLPDRAALGAARRFSKRIERDATWPDLLRRGIRGGTEGSILREIQGAGGEPLLLRPTRLGLNSHADLWYAFSTHARPHPVKTLMLLAFRAISRLSGNSYAPGLSVALRKLRHASHPGSVYGTDQDADWPKASLGGDVRVVGIRQGGDYLISVGVDDREVALGRILHAGGRLSPPQPLDALIVGGWIDPKLSLEAEHRVLSRYEAATTGLRSSDGA